MKIMKIMISHDFRYLLWNRKNVRTLFTIQSTWNIHLRICVHVIITLCKVFTNFYVKLFFTFWDITTYYIPFIKPLHIHLGFFFFVQAFSLDSAPIVIHCSSQLITLLCYCMFSSWSDTLLTNSQLISSLINWLSVNSMFNSSELCCNIWSWLLYDVMNIN